MTQEFSQNHCQISRHLTSVVVVFICLFGSLLSLQTPPPWFSVPYFPLGFILNRFIEHSLPSRLNCHPTLHQGPCLSLCIFLSSHTVNVDGEGRISIFPIPLPLPNHKSSPLCKEKEIYFEPIPTNSIILSSFSSWSLSSTRSFAHWQ